MTLRLLPLAEVESKTGSKKSRLYNRIAAGLFPPPIKFGKSSLWPSNEVDALIVATIRGASDDEIRRIVARLVDERMRCGLNGDTGHAA